MLRSFAQPVVALILFAVGATSSAAQGLPPVPAPPENPITAAKAVLGKVLFWDEQLSSDDRVACGTCHRPEAGGADPRVAVHPGPDRRFGTADDKSGSPGVRARDLAQRFVAHPDFGFGAQATRRHAPSAFTSQWAREQFWDGRASDTFFDPDTGTIVIPRGGSLESQALPPLLSDVEMGHPGRTFADVVAELVAARPLALATDLPADVQAALAAAPTYPALFRAAFGDPAITPVRIAFALATYERTLLPDRTPWDAFVAGNRTAMTPQQIAGWDAFQRSACATCHPAPQFTDDSFRNIGLRPVAEDRGLQEVTGKASNRGQFKVPSLRGVGERVRFMHHGGLGSLEQVVDFYARLLPQFSDNQDPAYQTILVQPADRAVLVAFLRGGLSDPRMTGRLPPFDRPTLWTERGGNLGLGPGSPGDGGRVPRLVADQPLFAGSPDFRIGVHDARAAAPVVLLLAAGPRAWPGFPVPIHIDAAAAIALPSAADGSGAATWALAVPAAFAAVAPGVAAQAFVFDPVATLGVAASDAVLHPPL